MTEHHAVFSKFTLYRGMAESGFDVDFIGAKLRCEFVSESVRHEAREVQPGYPPVDEEYFEWIDILEAAVSARGCFRVMELGAGYGRWAVRAFCAARQLGIGQVHLIAVEPEPHHFSWLQTHLRDNGIDANDHTLLHGVVSAGSGRVPFYVGMPGEKEVQPAAWYGQAMAGRSDSTIRKYPGAYAGFDLFEHRSGWKSIEIPSLRLRKLLEHPDIVHLIDLDVQGQELEILNADMKFVDRKVVRLHIGTHSREIEAGLTKLLTKHGWKCTASYAGESTSQTPWGPVTFGDGVQSWLNPRLADASR